jgi:hypothetical protein
MEDKKNLKRPYSPSNEGSSSPSKASTPPPSRSGSPPPIQSPPETSSHRLCLPPCEQGGPSEPVPIVDLASSSSEEDFFADTSWDEELARKLFGDLNRDILGPPGDGKIIVLSDSDDEDEAHEDAAVNVEVAPPSAVNSADTLTSAPDADKTPGGCKMIILTVGTRLVCLRLPRQDNAYREACFKERLYDRALLHHNFFCKEE